MNTQNDLQSAQTAQGSNPMDELPLDAFDFHKLHVGDVVDGVVISTSPTELLVDIGYKSDAVVDNREIERLDPDFLDNLTIGSSVVAYVLQTENKDGNVVISLTRAQQEADWRQAEELLNSQEIFDGIVTGYNRGGVIVKVGRVRGFVPGSQLSGRWQAQKDTNGDPEQSWSGLVGQQMQFKVVELDRQRNRLILSERAAMREWRKGQKDRLLSELKSGDTVTGIVTSIADFGAFVDIGGADGLIHLSELSWQRIGHPSEVLRVGQEVEVYVLNVEEERRRIALSLRRMTAEPWTTINDTYAIGQLVTATITKLTNFGAFARIDDAIEGLIHISELADYRVNHPKEVVTEGDEVQVRIIRIDSQRRRIGLSLRQAVEDAYVQVDWREEMPQELEEEPEAEQVVAVLKPLETE